MAQASCTELTLHKERTFAFGIPHSVISVVLYFDNFSFKKALFLSYKSFYKRTSLKINAKMKCVGAYQGHNSYQANAIKYVGAAVLNNRVDGQ